MMIARLLCLVLTLLAFAQVAAREQTPDPSTLPRLEQHELVNVGAFKVPNTYANGHFNYGGGVMAYSPDHTLLLSNDWAVAQITIPAAPVLSKDINALPRASFAKPFVRVLDTQRVAGVGPMAIEVTLGGLLVHAGKLYGAAFVYYDSANTQERTHFSHSLDLNDRASFRGWSQVWTAKTSGFVAGPMTPIPPEWQAKLGGTALTTPAAMPIITRTSFGPAAFAFDPTKIGDPVVPAVPLLYYPSSNPTLGQWGSSNPTWGGTTMIGGVVFVKGTRTMLYFGSNGIGPNCYGDGIEDKQAADASKGAICYDPTDPSKGSHAYPYRYQVWAYDLNDLVAVKEGRKQPWSVFPYGVWPIDLPITHIKQVRFTSVASDPVSGRIFAAQFKGEYYPDGGGQPLVWNFDPKVGTAPAPIPTPTPVPPVPVPTPTPAPVPPPPTDVEKLKAEITRLQADIAAERATVTKLNQQLADAQATGTKTTADLTAMRAARDLALKRIAEKDALAKQLIAK